MSKTKHNPPKKKEQNFIPFRKPQIGYLKEMQARQLRELNDALDEIYEDLGIKEKIFNAPPGKYRLRKDLSGLDVISIKLEIGKETEPPAGSPPQGTSEEKGGKDN